MTFCECQTKDNGKQNGRKQENRGGRTFGRNKNSNQIAIKDIFFAKVHKNEDGLQIKFPNGQSFTLAVWENQSIKKSSPF